ncbi:GTP-binding protein ypt2 [Polychytrium aggregatum]|uniref:GTP-binding protein ypt2 n=1 Tax=Polychytrium aggregatum TaxID=110093 RepID=UPI0022FE52EC|nr:GTP-binding protein ypt2 [Polychytrium aggregatum]KAI9203684.1 GTP-binding protein ypt2 [Polychytrium aggregatum]
MGNICRKHRPGVGKSCLLLRFVDDSFTPSFITTIGIDFKIRKVNIEGKQITLQIWDTAGQERFKTITTAYYRSAMGILVVYDVTDENSFRNVATWMKNVDEHAPEGISRCLIGNKCDLEGARVIPPEKGQALADEYGIEFMECSAKSNIGVEQAFMDLARRILRRRSGLENGDNASASASVQLNPNGGNAAGGGCSC